MQMFEKFKIQQSKKEQENNGGSPVPKLTGTKALPNVSALAKIETEFPANNGSPKIKHVGYVVEENNESMADVSDRDLGTKLPVMSPSEMELRTSPKMEYMDRLSKRALTVAKTCSENDTSPGKELLKLSDSFTDKFLLDDQNGLPAIQHMMFDSESEESDAFVDSQMYSMASTMSLNDILEKELDTMETPLDDDFSVDNFVMYDASSLQPCQNLASLCKSPTNQKDNNEQAQVLNNAVVMNNGQLDKNRTSTNNNHQLQRPNSLKLEHQLSRTIDQINEYFKSSDSSAEDDTPTNTVYRGSKPSDNSSAVSHSSNVSSSTLNGAMDLSHAENADQTIETAAKNTFLKPPVKPKPHLAKTAVTKEAGKNCRVNDKQKNALVEVNGTQVVNGVSKLGVNHQKTELMSSSQCSNSSTSSGETPDSAMQKSFSSSSGSSFQSTIGERQSSKDDGYCSNSAVSVPAVADNVVSLEVQQNDCRSSTPSTDSSLDASAMDFSRSPNSIGVSRVRNDSMTSSTSTSSVESNSLGRVRDIKAYWEGRSETSIISKQSVESQKSSASSNTPKPKKGNEKRKKVTGRIASLFRSSSSNSQGSATPWMNPERRSISSCHSEMTTSDITHNSTKKKSLFKRLFSHQSLKREAKFGGSDSCLLDDHSTTSKSSKKSTPAANLSCFGAEDSPISKNTSLERTWSDSCLATPKPSAKNQAMDGTPMSKDDSDLPNPTSQQQLQDERRCDGSPGRPTTHSELPHLHQSGIMSRRPGAEGSLNHRPATNGVSNSLFQIMY